MIRSTCRQPDNEQLTADNWTDRRTVLEMSSITLKQEANDKRTGVIITIVFHILLLILFLFIGLTQPDPLPKDEAIELSFEDAGGLTGGTTTAQPTTSQPPPTAAEPTPANEEVATDVESEVAIPKPVKPTPPKPKPEPAKPQPRKPDPNSLFAPSSTPSNSSAPAQSGGGPPSNTPGDGGSGTFKGKAFEGRLAGRGLVRGPNISEKPTEAGKVALDIFVDRSGKVTHVAMNLDRSTTTSQVLFNLAKKAAMQCTFSPKPDGPAEQKGDMTFIFILE